jgi:hypothetical protein
VSSFWQKELDFRCQWSVGVTMPIRALWPYLDPAPLAQVPLWGFVGGFLSPNSTYRGIVPTSRSRRKPLFPALFFASPAEHLCPV